MIERSVRFLITAVYLVAALEKILNIQALRGTLEASLLVPQALLVYAIVVVLGLEVLIPALLLFKCSRNIGYLLVCATGLAFLCFHVLELLRGGNRGCACFGGLRLPASAYIVINLCLFLTGFLLLRRRVGGVGRSIKHRKNQATPHVYGDR
jgi:hypothetical protein